MRRSNSASRVCGILVLFALPLINRVYIAGAEHGLPGMLLRGLVAAICLLPPTILMGASLPAIVRGIESTPRGVSWWSLLYGANLAGAIFGTLFAGFYLLRIYNMATATYVAAAINVAVAAISFALAGIEKAREGPASGGDIDGAAGNHGRRSVHARLDLHRHRAFRRDRAGRAGRLDAADGHAARLDDLRVLHHPGGVS